MTGTFRLDGGQAFGAVAVLPGLGLGFQFQEPGQTLEVIFCQSFIPWWLLRGRVRRSSA
jgi:hypothetical protein